jgi:hypothetical protein
VLEKGGSSRGSPTDRPRVSERDLGCSFSKFSAIRVSYRVVVMYFSRSKWILGISERVLGISRVWEF